MFTVSEPSTLPANKLQSRVAVVGSPASCILPPRDVLIAALPRRQCAEFGHAEFGREGECVSFTQQDTGSDLGPARGLCIDETASSGLVYRE